MDATSDWLFVESAQDLALRYEKDYKPDRMKISLFTRSWTAEVTGVGPVNMVSKSREPVLVNARMLWAHVMWGAGYSYPQIGRAMHRKDHSTAHHLLVSKRYDVTMLPYLRLAVTFGKNLGSARLEWLDGIRGVVDPLTGDARRLGPERERRRMDLMDLLERDMDFGNSPRTIITVPKVMSKRAAMRDLGLRMKQEAANG